MTNGDWCASYLQRLENKFLKQKITEEKDLRENMITDGIMWANEFNWEDTVKKTLEILL